MTKSAKEIQNHNRLLVLNFLNAILFFNPVIAFCPRILTHQMRNLFIKIVVYTLKSDQENFK